MRPAYRSGAPHWRLGLALTLFALLIHAASMVSLHRLAAGISGVQTMEEPLFTRLLAPTQPPSIAAPPPSLPPPPPQVRSAETASVPPAATPTVPTEANPEEAAKPAEVASEPAPIPKADEPKLTQADTIVNTARMALDTLGVRDPDRSAAAAPVVATISTSNPSSGTGTIDAWPTDTRLNYRVTGEYRGPINGKASVTWQRTGEKYQVLLNVDLGLIDVKMISQGIVKPQTLWPQVYEEMLSRPRRLRLDDQALAFQDGNTMARPPGVQDTVSQFVELTQSFATGRAKLEEGAVVHVPLARPGGFNDWYYDVIAEPALPTKLNHNYRELAAWHLKPRPIVNARGPITMEFWIVPELQYFPAKVRISLDKTSFLELDVDSIQQR